jgi:hypothetical protein
LHALLALGAQLFNGEQRRSFCPKNRSCFVAQSFYDLHWVDQTAIKPPSVTGSPVMKSRLKTGLIAAAALVFSSLGASADSIEFQNVTFSFTDLGSPAAGQRELQLEIVNADNATGDWTGINFLQAFAIKPDNNTYTSASTPGWSFILSNINNGQPLGCAGSADTSGFFCFYQPTDPFPISHDMTFDITFSGGNGGLINVAHLMVDFFIDADQTKSTGSLLSQDIVVPGPIVGAGLPGLIFACGGLLGLARHRRRKLA